MIGDVEQKKYRKDGAEAEEIVGFYSGQDRDGESVLIIAPHGGSMELNTAKQAERLHDELASLGTTTWTFRGTKGNQSAFDTWHVPSTKIRGEDPQFDLLQRYVDHRSFRNGISFHGYTRDGVLIGGQADKNQKQLVASELRETLPANISVEIAVEPGEYSGTNDNNILNRLSASPIQIEQSKKVRKRYWQNIVDILASLYR